MMKPIIDAARRAQKKRVAFAEGEEQRVLRAVQIIVGEGIARPTLIGRPAIIAQRIEKFGLRLQEELDYDIDRDGKRRRCRRVDQHQST